MATQLSLPIHTLRKRLLKGIEEGSASHAKYCAGLLARHLRRDFTRLEQRDGTTKAQEYVLSTLRENKGFVMGLLQKRYQVGEQWLGLAYNLLAGKLVEMWEPALKGRARIPTTPPPTVDAEKERLMEEIKRLRRLLNIQGGTT